MSRGLGKVERQILDALTRTGTGVEIRTLTGVLDGLNERGIRQAVQCLERQGWLEAKFLRGRHEQRWGGTSRVKVVWLAPHKRDVQDERTPYVPAVYQDRQEFNAHAYLTCAELLTQGWTEPMMLDFLGQPDLTMGRTYSKRQTNELYARPRVLAAKAQPEFQKRRQQLEQRRARRRKRDQGSAERR
jgi:hypothetical protein